MKGIGNDHPDCNYKTLCGDTWSFSRIQKELQHTKIDLLKLESRVGNGRYLILNIRKEI